MSKLMTHTALELQTKLIEALETRAAHLAFEKVGEEGTVTEVEVIDGFIEALEETCKEFRGPQSASSSTV